MPAGHHHHLPDRERSGEERSASVFSMVVGLLAMNKSIRRQVMERKL